MPSKLYSVPNLEQVRAELAERSLADFIRLGWRYIDPSDFLTNWHIDAICEHLEAVTRGEIRRLLINVPPRHMKSIGVSVAWPAWTWLQKPGGYKLAGPHVRWLYASYAQTLSIRDSVKCRRLIESHWYQSNWGDRVCLTSDQNTKIRFDNDKQGYRLATSVDGALTGEGGDVVVVDDPHNVSEGDSPNVRNSTLAWWDEAMSTRLNDPKTGAYVVIMQRGARTRPVRAYPEQARRLGSPVFAGTVRIGPPVCLSQRSAKDVRRTALARQNGRAGNQNAGNSTRELRRGRSASTAPGAAGRRHVQT